MFEKLVNLFKKKPKEEAEKPKYDCHFILEKNRITCTTHNIIVGLSTGIPTPEDKHYSGWFGACKYTCRDVRENAKRED